MKTLQKALDLLELVSTRDGEAVTPKTASEKLGINQSSCVRLMQTLTDRGYLTQVSRRAGYTGGPALTAYGCRKTCCNALAAAAVDRLLDMIEHRDPVKAVTLLPCTLIERESTGAGAQ